LRAVVYSYFAPLARVSPGGAQQAVDGMLRRLVARGVELVMLCPPAQPDQPLLDLGPRLQLRDQLRAVESSARQRVGPADVIHDHALIVDACDHADVVVSLDRAFPVQVECPVVLAINSLTYPPEAEAVFDLNWDMLVTPSDYLARCVSWYLEPGWQDGPPRPVVSNRYGIGQPAPTDGAPEAAILEELGLTGGGLRLSFPHRLDPDKGFETAVAALAGLLDKGVDATLLVPTPEDHEIWDHQRPYLAQRRDLVEAAGCAEEVRFHRWIHRSEMLAYLRSCHWTLNLSRLPEAFGLSAMESLAAGVPVISTPAGALPELAQTEHGIRYVEFEAPQQVVDTILAGPPSAAELAHGTRWVVETCAPERYADIWLELLGSARRCRTRFRARIPQAPSPWLRELPSGRLWDGYRCGYVPV
jgi:glycosyltransferase involved in cell wall biosynthesis